MPESDDTTRGEADAKTLILSTGENGESIKQTVRTLSADQQDTIIKAVRRDWGEDTLVSRDVQATYKSEGVRPLDQTVSHLKQKDLSFGTPTGADEDTKEPGAVPFDYIVAHELGKGGRGEVYLARQSSLKRAVALKIMREDRPATEEHKRSFIAEAVVTGNLDHPNIVPIHDAGVDASGRLFYTMKQIQGVGWDSILNPKTEEAKQTASQYSIVRHLGILELVSNAVAFAHSKHIIHRDLKPSNVMIGQFGEVTVVDWGLAARIDQEGAVDGPEGNTTAGTPSYMAPEMADPFAGRLGRWSDVYLLGAILYEILTGSAPHGGSGTVAEAMLRAARNEICPAELKANAPAELLEIAVKAMATDARDRHGTVEDFLAAIRDYRDHAESLRLTAEATETLSGAGANYEAYSLAIFALEEALKLWEGNQQAVRKLQEARAQYSRCALEKGDLELALSVLADSDGHSELRLEIEGAIEERDRRLSRLRNLKRATIALLAAVGISVTVAFFLIRAERDKAVAARRLAELNNYLLRVRTADKLTGEERYEEADEYLAEALPEFRGWEYDHLKQRIACRWFKHIDAFEGHKDVVTSLSFSPDGQFLASASGEADPSIRIWDLKEGKQIAQLLGHENEVKSVHYSPDGKRLASGSFDDTVRVWDAATGQQLMQLNGSEFSGVDSVAFSPDGRRLACGNGENVLKVWDVENGAELMAIKAHKGRIVSVAFSPDGKMIATASGDGTAAIHDAETGEKVAQFEGHQAKVAAVAFSPDGTRLATASWDGTLRIWDAETQENLATVEAHAGRTDALGYDPAGRRLVSGGADGLVKFWDAGTLKEIAAIHAHEGGVKSVEFGPGGDLVASAGDDGLVKVWNALIRKEVMVVESGAENIRALAYSPDGRTIAAAASEQRVRVWDADSGEELDGLSSPEFEAACVAYSPDGEGIALAGHVARLNVWDVREARAAANIIGHPSVPTALACEPGGGVLACGGAGGTIGLWDMHSGAKLADVGRHDSEVTSLAYSETGNFLASGSEDGTIKMWDLRNGTERSTGETHGAPVNFLAFCGRGMGLVSASRQGSLKIWSVLSGKEIYAEQLSQEQFVTQGFSLRAETLAAADFDRAYALDVLDLKVIYPGNWGKRLVKAVSLSPDGKQLACGIEDGLTDVIDMAKLERAWASRGGEAAVESLAYTPDSKCLAVGDSEGTIRLRDAKTGSEVKSWSGGCGAVFFLAFGPDGHTLLSRGMVGPLRGALKVWDVDSGKARMTLWQSDTSAVFSPDGGLLAAVGLMGALQVRALRTTESLSPILREDSPVTALAYSGDGSHLATATVGGTVSVREARTWREVARLDGHEGGIFALALTSDARRLASGSQLGLVRIWDTRKGAEVRALRAHGGLVTAVCFSPDGKVLASASTDSTIKLWDSASGKELATLRGHEGAVTALAYGHMGDRLASASADSSVTIWDTTTGSEVITLEEHRSPVTALAFSPDGERLASVDTGGTILIWF